LAQTNTTLDCFSNCRTSVFGGLRLQQRIDKEKRQQQQQQQKLQLQALAPVAAASSKERATIRTPTTQSSTATSSTSTTATSSITTTTTTTTTSPKAEEDDPRVVEFWSIVHRRNAIRLTNQIKQLQGFWVKVGQFLSSRADVMPMEYIQELSSLQDSLPAKPLHDILSTLREEWGLIDNSSRARISSCSGNSKTSSTRTTRSLSTSSLDDTPEDYSNDDDNPHRLQQLEALLESMDPIPLSTASLAQVHRARLPLKNRIDDGDEEDDSSTGKSTNKNRAILKHPPKQQLYQDVVFKVQHVGIASLMRQDMENLKVIVGILAKMEPDFDFEPVFREYNQEVEKELDFRREARNMEEVRSLLLVNDDDDDNEHLNLPQQNEETTTTTATTSSSIVSSFLTASSFSGTSRPKQSSPKVKAIIPRVLHEYTTERVLVMEFCPGFAVRELEQMEQHNVNKHLLLERICTSWAIQMHVGGFFNAGT
jgi:predicted unusual protein kinase regulating ubiquinone biosynthesis (AarF/ABC1/UbiB family)